MIEAAEELIRFARAYAAHRLPWFAPALFRCRLLLDQRVPLAAIDYDYNIYFNPDNIRRLSDAAGSREKALAQVGFLWIHEISHVLRDHGERAREANAQANLWNLAADLEINDAAWPGIVMPDGEFAGVEPLGFNYPTGLLAEQYYQRVQEDGYQVPDSEIWLEGSGSHGEVRSWELGEDRQQLSDLQRELTARETARELLSAGQQGALPGGWKRWAEEKLEGKVDWRKVLRRRMRTAISVGLGNRTDYSFRRPNRRQAVYHPVITPRLSGSLAASVACVVDTSSSVGKKELSRCIGEVMRILRDFQLPVTVIPCDARAYKPVRVHAVGEQFKLRELAGGGGTNMIRGIEAALDLQPTPDAVLVLTDGYTPYPTITYGTPVVFGIFERAGQRKGPQPPNPPWPADSVVPIVFGEK